MKYLLGLSTVGLLFFLFGLSVGHYKHEPYPTIWRLTKGGGYLPAIEWYESRNIDTRHTIVRDIQMDEQTGIYLTYGQSNSANSGELKQEVYPGVYQFFLGEAYHYQDPSLGVTGRGGSVWGLLGKKLIAHGVHSQVIFANSGWGGKSIEALKAGSDFQYLLFNHAGLVEKFGKVDAILYHQGEADNHPTRVHNYYHHFMDFLNNLRKAGVTAPIYLSRASFCGLEIPPNSELIDHQNQLIADNLTVLKGPNTDLLSDQRLRKDDYCHFSAAGNEEFAKLWVERIVASDYLGSHN